MHSFNLSIILLICCIHMISSNVDSNTCIVSPESECVKPDIIMAHIIFRHGDRNPHNICPNDPWKDPKFWPEGFSQLTNIGKRQVFELGEWLANRYQPLFPNGYSFDAVKVYTPDLDRTMMSGAACLAGLFPPKEQQIWSSNLHWQPIPIHVFDRAVDTKIRNRLNKCKLRDTLNKEYMKSKEAQQLFKTYRNTIDYVTKMCGDSIDIYQVHDSLNIEMLKNRTTPAWATEIIFNDLEKLRVFNHKSSTATPQLARLRIGFLMKEIFENFNNKARGMEKNNFILYSAQDVTIVSILNAMGIFDNELVPYAACVMFELYQEDDEFYVQIAYKKGNVFTMMNIPDCGTKCPLREIIKKYQAILPENDYETECKNKE